MTIGTEWPTLAAKQTQRQAAETLTALRLLPDCLMFSLRDVAGSVTNSGTDGKDP